MSEANSEFPVVELANGIKVELGVVIDGPAEIKKDGVEYFAQLFSITRWPHLFDYLAEHLAKGKNPDAEELITFVRRDVERCGVEWTPKVAAAVILAVSREMRTPILVLDNFMQGLDKSFARYVDSLEVVQHLS